MKGPPTGQEPFPVGKISRGLYLDRHIDQTAWSNAYKGNISVLSVCEAVITHLCTPATVTHAKLPVSALGHWHSTSPAGPQWEGSGQRRHCDRTVTTLGPTHGRSYHLSWASPSGFAECKRVWKGRAGRGCRGTLPVCRCWTGGAAFPVYLVVEARPCLLVTWHIGSEEDGTN